MIKKLLLSTVAGLAMAIVPLSTAGAWTATLSGSGKCQPDGSFLITWKLHNHEESKFKVTLSSNETVVPVGTEVNGNTTSNFPQSVDGSKPGIFTLSLNGRWKNSDETEHMNASVRLEHACRQPATITVNKQVSPAGDQTSFSVTIASSDKGVVYGNATQNVMGGGSVVYKVSPGTYNVTEAAVSGWTQTSNTCSNLVITKDREVDEDSVNIQSQNVVVKNQNKDCTIVNTKNATGGQGGQVLAVTTQVQAPKGGVGAGIGGASGSNFGAALGIIGSLGAVGYGLRRLSKSEL